MTNLAARWRLVTECVALALMGADALVAPLVYFRALGAQTGSFFLWATAACGILLIVRTALERRVRRAMKQYTSEVTAGSAPPWSQIQGPGLKILGAILSTEFILFILTAGATGQMPVLIAASGGAVGIFLGYFSLARYLDNRA